MPYYAQPPAQYQLANYNGSLMQVESTQLASGAFASHAGRSSFALKAGKKPSRPLSVVVDSHPPT